MPFQRDPQVSPSFAMHVYKCWRRPRWKVAHAVHRSLSTRLAFHSLLKPPSRAFVLKQNPVQRNAQSVQAARQRPANTCQATPVHVKPSQVVMDIAIQHPWFRRALGYPSRIFDQFFGEGLFDYDLFPYAASTISPYYRHSLFRNFLDSSNSGISEVRSDRDKFTVYLDVKHFSPEDLNVKVADDYVEIQGKHGERQDDHGYISREFHRRYRLPSNVDQSAITCTLSNDGLLVICGPKTGGSETSRGDRNIPVTRDDKTNAAPSS